MEHFHEHQTCNTYRGPKLWESPKCKIKLEQKFPEMVSGNAKVSVPSLEHSETRQISPAASCPGSSPEHRELGLNPSGTRSNFVFTTLFSQTASLWGWKRPVQQQHVCHRSGLAEPRGRSFCSPSMDGLRLCLMLSQGADPTTSRKNNHYLS